MMWFSRRVYQKVLIGNKEERLHPCAPFQVQALQAHRNLALRQTLLLQSARCLGAGAPPPTA